MNPVDDALHHYLEKGNQVYVLVKDYPITGTIKILGFFRNLDRAMDQLKTCVRESLRTKYFSPNTYYILKEEIGKLRDISFPLQGHPNIIWQETQSLGFESDIYKTGGAQGFIPP